MWEGSLWGAVYAEDKAMAFAVDATGNVIVTGSSDSSTDPDYVTIKYDSNGAWVWGKRYYGPANKTDMPSDLAVDAAGNVYVTGYSNNAANHDYVTIKYNFNGNWVWGRRYGFYRDDEPTALAVDASKNIYVTGYSWSNKLFHYKYATIKYSPDDACLWEERYDGPD